MDFVVVWWTANHGDLAPADFSMPSFCKKDAGAGQLRPLSPPPNDPIDSRPPRSEPAHTQHVGSISTAHGALSRRRRSQCLEQDSFGTTPAHPPPADGSRELPHYISGLIVILGVSSVSSDIMADELDGTARGIDVELLYRGSCLFAKEQRPPHRRHRFRYRIDRMVLADVWPQRRCHDARGRRVSGRPCHSRWRGYSCMG